MFGGKGRKGLDSNVVFQRIWVIGKTVNWFLVLILQKLFEISKLTSKNQKNISVFLQMFQNVIFCLETLPTYMTMILNICDSSCGKEVSDNVYNG